MTIPKRWQTDLWLGERLEQHVVVYGESLEDLRTAVRQWLTVEQPLDFGNAPLSCSLPERVRRYFYSDGRRQIPIFCMDDSDKMETLSEGWYWVEATHLYPQPHSLPDFDRAITHFIETAMIVEAGPDYQEPVSAKESYWGRLITHPAIHGGVIGLMIALCTLAMPVFSQGDKSLLLVALNNVTYIIMFIATISALFAAIGLVIFRILSMRQWSKD